MSRVSKRPIFAPKEVAVSYKNRNVSVKGPKGSMSLSVPTSVVVKVGNDADNENVMSISCSPQKKGVAEFEAMAGTIKSLINNMVIGVSTGFERKLELVGVGYRANIQGRALQLSLGFSHPVKFVLPEGVMAELPANNVIILRGCDKQLVGQAAAKIRSFRPPEPYKGKGVKYSDERIIRKETKKK